MLRSHSPSFLPLFLPSFLLSSSLPAGLSFPFVLSDFSSLYELDLDSHLTHIAASQFFKPCLFSISSLFPLSPFLLLLHSSSPFFPRVALGLRQHSAAVKPLYQSIPATVTMTVAFTAELPDLPHACTHMHAHARTHPSVCGTDSVTVSSASLIPTCSCTNAEYKCKCMNKDDCVCMGVCVHEIGRAHV